MRPTGVKTQVRRNSYLRDSYFHPIICAKYLHLRPTWSMIKHKYQTIKHKYEAQVGNEMNASKKHETNTSKKHTKQTSKKHATHK